MSKTFRGRYIFYCLSLFAYSDVIRSENNSFTEEIVRIIQSGAPVATKEACSGYVNISGDIEKELNFAVMVKALPFKTPCGELVFCSMLKNPFKEGMKNKSLAKRRKIISLLVEDGHFKNALGEILQELRPSLEMLADFLLVKRKAILCPSYYEEYSLKEDKVVSPFRYLRKKLKSNISWYICETLGSLVSIVGTPFVLYNFVKNGSHKRFIEEITHIKAIVNNQESSCVTKEDVDRIGELFCALVYGPMFIYSSYVAHKKAIKQKEIVRSFRLLVDAIVNIENMFAEANLDKDFNLLFFEKNCLKDWQSILYNNPFYLPPLLEKYLYCLCENEESLIYLLFLIGELDVYHTIATCIAEKNDSKPFCCVDFLEKETTPSLQTAGAWNIGFKNPVANNLNTKKSIILTGPNAGGKSTLIRMVMQNILLAQTLGVAAAESWCQTPFDVICFYLNIQDSFSEGESLFTTELKRSKAILARVAGLSS
ncbi:MAG: hypothetical protein WBQ73_00455, partial [Candidatus Babeliales bacterium]